MGVSMVSLGERWTCKRLSVTPCPNQSWAKIADTKFWVGNLHNQCWARDTTVPIEFRGKSSYLILLWIHIYFSLIIWHENAPLHDRNIRFAKQYRWIDLFGSIAKYVAIPKSIKNFFLKKAFDVKAENLTNKKLLTLWQVTTNFHSSIENESKLFNRYFTLRYILI